MVLGRQILNLHKRDETYFFLTAATSSAALGVMWLYSKGWRSKLIHCYFQDIFGIIGPGCGLTRSLVALINGQLQKSVSYHAFGPAIFLGFIGLLAFSLISLLTSKRVILSPFRKYHPLFAIGFAVSLSAVFIGYYALRVIARYYNSALPSSLTTLDAWQFIVTSSNSI
ncbi:DUF2752 domain-containing protein [Nodosilinea sp. FACHB-141]|nr:DUF2752 domain-containing protein [Nodosilinea sp. FACHB-141]